MDDQEETGWKYIHGDVFRFPPHLSLFCACVGTGSQILTMAVCIFALALVGVFYPYNRGALLTACVVSHLQKRQRCYFASLSCREILISKDCLSIHGSPLAEDIRSFSKRRCRPAACANLILWPALRCSPCCLTSLCAQLLYALTAGVAGYVASLCYKMMGGTNWVRNVLLTTALFCGPMLACFSFLNTVAIIYRVSFCFPF